MKLAVQMLIWNGQDFVEKALRSVMPYAWEVFVYDSGSTDNTMRILAGLQKEFSKLIVKQRDVQHLGQVWAGSEKDIQLTSMLNEMKFWTDADWILKIDDDEVFPGKTMDEITCIDGSVPIYSIPFLHFEGLSILDPAQHTNFYVARLFKNIPIIHWKGRYGREQLAYDGKTVSSHGKSKLCEKLTQPFLHLGNLRSEDRKHNYRFHEKGHCGLPIPSKYYHYVF